SALLSRRPLPCHYPHHYPFPTRRSSDLDPHIWLDPIRMIQTAEIVTKELTALAPEHEETSQANLTTLEENLTHLHEQFEKTLDRSEEHTSELQSRFDLVCRLLLE